MSETLSSVTKTDTASLETDSVESPLVLDRWTNNITYRQLVISTCVSIFQVWWHPYLYDFRRLIPFLFLYQMFSIAVAYPMFYLELALGVVTKKGVLRCWDIAPIARGIGFAMLFVCLFSALVASAVGAWSLALFVHSVHSFLPWLHCAAAAQPPCAARHRPLPEGSETPPQSFFFNYVLELKRGGLVGGLGNIVWELSAYYIICWLLVYCVVIKRIYSYSKVVLFKDVLTFFVLLSCAVGVTRLEGSGKIFKECDWSVLMSGFTMWHEALEYSLLEMSVGQGSLIMLGSHCPKTQQKLGLTAMLAFVVSKTSCMSTALILGATHGALSKDYDNSTNIRPGSSQALVLWADFVARVPGSQFWAALVFFTIFVVAVSTAGLLVQTVMSTFTGHSIRKIRWAFLIVICLLFGFVGVITLCTQGGLYLMDFVMNWPVTKPRIPIAVLFATVITYIYGQTTFCEDVFFAVGEYPNVFMRICWALSPAMMMAVFAVGANAWRTPDAIAGWVVVLISMLPIIVVITCYAIFKCRIRNIVGDEK